MCVCALEVVYHLVLVQISSLSRTHFLPITCIPYSTETPKMASVPKMALTFWHMAMIGIARLEKEGEGM